MRENHKAACVETKKKRPSYFIHFQGCTKNIVTSIFGGQCVIWCVTDHCPLFDRPTIALPPSRTDFVRQSCTSNKVSLMSFVQSLADFPGLAWYHDSYMWLRLWVINSACTYMPCSEQHKHQLSALCSNKASWFEPLCTAMCCFTLHDYTWSHWVQEYIWCCSNIRNN